MPFTLGVSAVESVCCVAYAEGSRQLILCLVRPQSVRTEDIVAFVQREIEPLPPYPPQGLRYRVSATLMDGTHLPCVVIESSAQRAELAIKRFDETRGSSDPYMGYRAIVG